MKPVSYVHSTNKQHSKCFCCVTGEDFLWTFSLFRSVSPRLHVEAEVRGQMNKKVLAWVLHNFFFSSGINSLGIYALATVYFWLQHFSLSVNPGFISEFFQQENLTFTF